MRTMAMSMMRSMCRTYRCDTTLPREFLTRCALRRFQMCSLVLIVGSSVLIGLEDPLEATALAQRKAIQDRPCTTTDGIPCQFPFLFEGQEYSECIRRGNYGFLWCSTTYDYFEDQEWGYCDNVLCDKLGPGNWRHTLQAINLLAAGLLILESLPAIVAHGLVLGHNAYLRKVTNVLDFVVLISNLLDLFFTLAVPSLPDEEVTSELAISRDVVRCFRALRALRLLRVANKFAILRNTVFLLGSVTWSLVVSVAVNSVFLLAFALVGQELWNSAMHLSCHHVDTGLPEWPPRLCDPAATAGRFAGGFAGGLHGRRCPAGFSCIGGQEQPLEDPAVARALVDASRAPQGLKASFSNFRAASSTMISVMMLDTWSTLLYQTVDAVGPMVLSQLSDQGMVVSHLSDQEMVVSQLSDQEMVVSQLSDPEMVVSQLSDPEMVVSQLSDPEMVVCSRVDQVPTEI